MKIPILSKLFQRRSNLATPEKWFIEALASRPSATGVTVNENTALQSTAVFACVRILAETIASLPLPVYRRLEPRGKQRAFEHPLYSVLHDIANEEMTSYTLRETLMGHVLLWGNAYAEIEYDRASRVRGLWPLRPDKTRPQRNSVTKEIEYKINLPDGSNAILPSERVLHIVGLGFDGLVGYSPIRMAREAIGLSLAAEEFGARFFGNGAQLNGVLQHPHTLGENAIKNLKESFEEKYSGLSKSHRLMILEEGMTYNRIGIPPDEAQFLETRKFQVTEIARLFRVPPHMLADLERATFSNIEHQSIEFVQHTIRPWLVRWEQAIKMKLFTPAERREFFAEFLVDGLLRGDIKSRYDAYAVGRQNGWLSANDIRELENMNPISEGGDIYLVPLNMVPAAMIGQISGDGSDGDTRSRGSAETRTDNHIGARQNLANSFKRLFEDAIARIIRRETVDAMRAAEKYFPKRNAELFEQWVEDFYEEYPEFIQRQVEPVYMSYAEAVQAEAAAEIGLEPGMTPELKEFVAAYMAAFIMRYTGSSRGQIKKLVREAVQKGEDPIAALQKRFDEWTDTRPDRIASREVIQANNAIARAVYISGGVTKLRWAAVGKNCPYCNHLNGKVIGINSVFISKDEGLQPEGVDEPLRPSSNVGHPPAHRKCNCFIFASS